MIREIAAKSLGAQIKIMSSREVEREMQDCVVTIAGSLKNKQDACALIIEQIEVFRSGARQNANNRNGDRDNTRNIERNNQPRDNDDKYLSKRQEYKKNSRSGSHDR